MCGISGIVAKNSKIYEVSLLKMIESLHHRGPDNKGFHHFINCSLGHARLSIVDLETGKQPMLNPNKDIAVVFNGEIYGFQEIKAKILVDYQFITTSDTELILALFNKFQKQFINYLPGAFSFAIWDDNEQELICARDRFGEKPFYYAFGKNNEFIFASEIKAIIASGLMEPELNNDAIAYYLKNLYIHPFENIYSNIYTLPPAHILFWKNGNLSINKYWRIPEINQNITMEEASSTFAKLLEQSVARQLIADVPVSAFLSGGLDSSTIVALAAKINPDINVFTFGFDDTINETSLAKKTAERYNLQIKELHADNYNLAELLQNMQLIFDEPFADSSNIPTYLISKEVSKYAKVVLTGDGGDELLGGYEWYLYLYELAKKNNNSNLMQAFYYLLQTKLSFLFKYRTNRYEQNINSIKDVRNNSVREFHFHQKYIFSEAEIHDLLNKKTNYKKYIDIPLSNTVNDAMFLDISDYMPGDILVKIDRSSMANSLELRAPFLDINVAEFCLSLPSNLKIDGKTTKKILRESFQEKWINELKTAKKQGFGAPVNRWLKTKDFQVMLKDNLYSESAKLYKFINYDAAKRYFHQANYKTWTLLNLSLWAESHFFHINHE